jgi:branched-chain amino acid transport system substrate-binding protein
MSVEQRYSRGRLLRLAGVGAGAAAAGPLLRVDEAFGGRTAQKIGVLVPSGSRYPRMGENLLAGLELGLDRTGAAATSLVVRHVEGGYAGAYGSARELLDGGADLVVAGVSAPVARQLEPLFRERRRPLIVANVGAHVVRPDERSPFVLHNSLLDWQAAYSMGVWAAGHAGRRVLVLTSMADAGYDSIYAFRRGLATSGGRVVETIVTHAGETQSLRSRLDDLAETPSAVYVVASGKNAAEIVRAYRASGLRAPLLASAFAVDDYVLPSLGAGARGVRSVASWATAVADKDFAAAYKQRSGRRPDAFAVLGYETALLLAAGMRRRDGLIAALHGARVHGLRGTLTVDPRTNTVDAPLYLRKVRGLPGRAANVVLRRAPAVGAFPRALAPIAREQTSGYINEYLCA